MSDEKPVTIFKRLGITLNSALWFAVATIVVWIVAYSYSDTILVGALGGKKTGVVVPQLVIWPWQLATIVTVLFVLFAALTRVRHIDAREVDLSERERKFAAAQAAAQAAEKKTMEQLRQEVETEWQRDKQSELEAELQRYASYVQGRRSLKANYEAAVINRRHRIAQMELLVIDIYPETAMAFDPKGEKGPVHVGVEMCKLLKKKFKDEAGLLRESQNSEVKAKLGSMADLPLAPPPIPDPVYIPIPEKLLKKFGDGQVQNY